MTDTPGALEERLRVPLPEGMCGQSMGCNAASICLCSHIEDQRELLTEAADEIASLRARVEAYRLLAVNEGWKHIMVEAYGHREYLRQRVEEVDRKAAGTVASGYDAAAYLRDALKGPSQ